MRQSTGLNTGPRECRTGSTITAENNALHNQVNTRSELKEYDPALAGLCAEVFGDGDWPYRRPRLRAPADRAHLLQYDRDAAPRFV